MPRSDPNINPHTGLSWGNAVGWDGGRSARQRAKELLGDLTANRPDWHRCNCTCYPYPAPRCPLCGKVPLPCQDP